MEGMKRWLNALFRRSVHGSELVEEKPSTSTSALQRVLELTEEAWVREKLETVPLNRILTIRDISVALQQDLQRQGITNARQLDERFGELGIAPTDREIVEPWLQNMRRQFQGEYTMLRTRALAPARSVELTVDAWVAEQLTTVSVYRLLTVHHFPAALLEKAEARGVTHYLELEECLDQLAFPSAYRDSFLTELATMKTDLASEYGILRKRAGAG